MKLVVLNSPTLLNKAATKNTNQRVIALYNPSNDVTTINCDVDVVTLGLVVNVLQEQYDSYLANLDTNLADMIRKTTKEAVDHCTR